jgi:hypothetical protein
MEDRNYRSYPEEFILEAPEMLRSGGKKSDQIERELGITTGRLCGNLG